MSATILVTRNVSARVRGFLASSLLELAPGIYCGARISPAVRDRIWVVLEDWLHAEHDASIVMLWHDRSLPGEQAILVLGSPPVSLFEHDGLILSCHPATPTDGGDTDGQPDTEMKE